MSSFIYIKDGRIIAQIPKIAMKIKAPDTLTCRGRDPLDPFRADGLHRPVTIASRSRRAYRSQSTFLSGLRFGGALGTTKVFQLQHSDYSVACEVDDQSVGSRGACMRKAYLAGALAKSIVAPWLTVLFSGVAPGERAIRTRTRCRRASQRSRCSRTEWLSASPLVYARADRMIVSFVALMAMGPARIFM